MKKMNFHWSVLTFVMVSLLGIGLTSCKGSDEKGEDVIITPIVLPVEQVAGSYVGTLKPMGYADEPARCYVTVSKLSSDAVRLEKLICEEFDLDMNPVNLIIKEETDGRITLRSETSKSVEGSYYHGQLTLSFSNSKATFYFSGTKN